MANVPPDEERNGNSNGPRGARPFSANLIFLVVTAIIFLMIYLATSRPAASEVPFHVFEGLVANDPENILRLEVGDYQASGVFREPPEMADVYDEQGEKVVYWNKNKTQRRKYSKQFFINLPKNDSSRDKLQQLLRDKKVPFTYATTTSSTIEILWLAAILGSLLMFGIFWFQFRRTRDQMMGGGFLTGFAKSPAKRYEASKQPITFKDVAGLEGVKADLLEIVEFLKSPQKFQKLGGRIPKGVLLVGPPGTGKTLLARAVAGEAGVPFFSVNGSEFIQMFVGVGASRVRDLFKTAKDNSPCIIFIDEIDAVGRQRGAGLGGGHDEREQTLNQILGEMDGFSQTEAVIVLAATNRPDVLDPALLRPGRFDRHVLVDRPDIRGREAILKVHVKNVRLDPTVELTEVASLTPGFVGADLANLVNEAALLAARNNKQSVGMKEFNEGVERVTAGLEKKQRVMNEDEKLRVAYHESGHALVAYSLPNTDPVHKVSIIPRGLAALGYTMQRPEGDRYLMTQAELESRIQVLLAGTLAEEIVFRDISTGAQNDLERATEIARSMVMDYGMSRLGRVNYRESNRSVFLAGAGDERAKSHSEQTAREIDLEVKRIIDESLEKVRHILETRSTALESLTRRLIDVESVDAVELKRIVEEATPGPQVVPGTAPTPTQAAASSKSGLGASGVPTSEVFDATVVDRR